MYDECYALIQAGMLRGSCCPLLLVGFTALANSAHDACRRRLGGLATMSAAFRSRTPAHDFEADVTCRWTVGPGAYDLFSGLDKLPAHNNRSSFKSRRWHARPPVPTPGPGAYTPKAWGIRTDRGVSIGPSAGPAGSSGVADSSSCSSFVWTRRATAPSIPSIDQAMGYEEDADGQLVPQEAIQPPAGGVAPNHYSPTMARQLV